LRYTLPSSPGSSGAGALTGVVRQAEICIMAVRRERPLQPRYGPSVSSPWRAWSGRQTVQWVGATAACYRSAAVRVSVDGLRRWAARRVRNLQSAQLRDQHANSNMVDGSCHTVGERSPGAAALRGRAERGFRAWALRCRLVPRSARINRYGAVPRPGERRIMSPGCQRTPIAASTCVNARPAAAASRGLAAYLPRAGPET